MFSISLPKQFTKYFQGGKDATLIQTGDNIHADIFITQTASKKQSTVISPLQDCEHLWLKYAALMQKNGWEEQLWRT